MRRMPFRVEARIRDEDGLNAAGLRGLLRAHGLPNQPPSQIYEAQRRSIIVRATTWSPSLAGRVRLAEALGAHPAVLGLPCCWPKLREHPRAAAKNRPVTRSAPGCAALSGSYREKCCAGLPLSAPASFFAGKAALPPEARLRSNCPLCASRSSRSCRSGRTRAAASSKECRTAGRR